MILTVSPVDLGTPESAWLESSKLIGCQPLVLPKADCVDTAQRDAPKRIVVIAPHPGDEVFGAGGTLRRFAKLGYQCDVVAVTDGEASHPRSTTTTGDMLRTRRERERFEALCRLGVENVRVIKLDYPDGGITKASIGVLAHDLAPSLNGATWCLAPWHRDGHPDHDATGLAAKTACDVAKVPIAQYLVRAWHWAKPDRERDIPWSRARKISLSAEEAYRKHDAIDAYQSQIAPLSRRPGDEATLPLSLVARLTRSFEVFLV